MNAKIRMIGRFCLLDLSLNGYRLAVVAISLILLFNSIIPCYAEEGKPLFKWDSRMNAGITGSHMATTIQVSLGKGVEKDAIIDEIIGLLKNPDLSKQMIDGYAIRDALQTAGLRDADALSLALSSLTKQPFEIFEDADSQERDRAIRDFVRNCETKRNAHKVLLMFTFACLAITAFLFAYWLVSKFYRKQFGSDSR